MLNVELGNGQLHQRGSFFAAFVSAATHPAGVQMFAAVGIQVSEADFSSFKSDLFNLWLFRNVEMSFFSLQSMDNLYEF